MSPPNRPLASSLSGIMSLKPTINLTGRTAVFADKNGQGRTLKFEFWCDGSGKGLTIEGDDGSVCSFRNCPSPDEALWFVSGLNVVTHRCGIASHIYALARDLLSPCGAAITPSGNVFPDGVELWNKLDPSVKFREQKKLPGYYEPI